MKVLKFGSATIATPEAMKQVADILSTESGNIVVLSSIHGTAEALEEISDYLHNKNQEGAAEIINRLELTYMQLVSSLFVSENYKTKGIDLVTQKLDFIRSFSDELFTLIERRTVMAQGELLSSELFNLYLHQKGIKSVLLPALDFIRTDKNALPDATYIKEQLSILIKNNSGADIYITQGYICQNSYGEIADLGKGGSDHTASLIGAAIKAQEIQIWASVIAMLNNDPRYIKNTSTIKQLNFDEAAELAYFGAKILHPSCIMPAKLANIPVRLKCTKHAQDLGTLISNQTEANSIKAIGTRDKITAIKIKSGRMLMAHGFLRRIFEVFENHQTSIDMLSSSEIGVSMTIDDNRKLPYIIEDLKKYGTVMVEEDMVIVSIVGDLGLQNTTNLPQILTAINPLPIHMLSYGGSKYNFSILIHKKDKESTLKRLNDTLFD